MLLLNTKLNFSVFFSLYVWVDILIVRVHNTETSCVSKELPCNVVERTIRMAQGGCEGREHSENQTHLRRHTTARGAPSSSRLVDSTKSPTSPQPSLLQASRAQSLPASWFLFHRSSPLLVNFRRSASLWEQILHQLGLFS